MATVTDRQRSLEQLAREALDVQDACNLRGILLGWHRAACELFSLPAPPLPGGQRGEHPIMLLWADKVLDLMGRPKALVTEYDSVAYSEAIQACQKLAGR